MRDIWQGGEQALAGGFEGVEGSGDEVEEDIEVMDHDIVYHADIGGSEAVGAGALCFDVVGVLDIFFGFLPGGIKAFDVSYLEFAVIFLCDFDEFLGLGAVGGDGFFDEEVDAFFEEGFGHFVVGGGGGGDARGFDIVGEFLDVGEVGNLEFFPDFSSPFLAGIHDADQLGFGELGVDPCVVFS